MGDVRCIRCGEPITPSHAHACPRTTSRVLDATGVSANAAYGKVTFRTARSPFVARASGDTA